MAMLGASAMGRARLVRARVSRMQPRLVAAWLCLVGLLLVPSVLVGVIRFQGQLQASALECAARIATPTEFSRFVPIPCRWPAP